MKIRLFKSFRTKILLSFYAFIGVLIAWLAVYFYINYKQQKLQNFLNTLTFNQNNFLESNRYLQYFILQGYHDKEFYVNHKQKDLEVFLNQQHKNALSIDRIRTAARKNNFSLDTELTELYNSNIKLIDSVILLQELYYRKGYKDWGAEGNMRRYAHILEDSALISEVNLLQLRRHEKDYLLRGEIVYAEQFDSLANQLLFSYPQTSRAYEVLNNYKTNFNKLVHYSDQLGMNTTFGIYSQVQNLINAMGKQYSVARSEASKEILKLQNEFMTILVVISVFLFIFGILLSSFLSRLLTKDIKELNTRMFSFINSGFKDYEEVQRDRFIPTITEIAHLNKDFLLLKKSLKNTLKHLEDSYEEVKKASDYKSIFLANMSHEIRTPLNGIIGVVHLLKGSKLTEEQQDFINTVEFSADHLLDLINMILDYSKIEAGKMDLEGISFDLKGDMVKLVKIFEYRVIEKGLNLKLVFDADNTHYLIGDPLRLQQILINLISNAVKFTKTGSITFTIRQLHRNGKSARIYFEVEDSGIGIHQDKTHMLFEAFKQADTSTTRNFGGTGLGLTISHQLVKLMGGDLEVNSEINKGSKFFFELDIKIGDEIKQKPEMDPKISGSFTEMRVLLAEDNQINQKVISLMLKKFVDCVDIANNGLEAYELFKENHYDMIFMDIRMPEMDGLQSTSLIQQTEKYKGYPTPIIAITANAFNEDRKVALDAGMNDFLSKPIKPVELEGILAKYNIRSDYPIKA